MLACGNRVSVVVRQVKVRMKIRLRTLFVLTALVALVSLYFAPSPKSPLPGLIVQIIHSPPPYSIAVNSREDDIVTAYYARLLDRLNDERQINLAFCADPMAELRRIIRVTPSSSDVNSTIMTISAWRTPIVSKLDDLKAILGIACEVIQDTQLPGIRIDILVLPGSYHAPSQNSPTSVTTRTN